MHEYWIIMDENNSPNVRHNESTREKYKQTSIDDEKMKVRKQVDDLEKIISDIESQLEIITYGEYEIIGKSLSLNINSQSYIRENIKDILQYELLKLSGIYCSKVTEDECIFNFSSTSSFQSPYAVQIFTKDETVELGAWVMPWGITIDRTDSETPLKSSKDVIPFLKSCKRDIQCHAEREEQFEKLKESTSSIKNVEIDATLGYITILCHFLGVHDHSTDKKFNLTVNLHYGTGRVRPSSINIEWNLKEKITDNTLIKLRAFVKSFRTENLIDSFKKIKELSHSLYFWEAEEYTDSVLDVTVVDYSSGSNSYAETSEKEDTEYYRKRRKTRRVRKRGAKPLSYEKTTDTNPNPIRENAVMSGEHENNIGELSRDISDTKPQSKKRKKKFISAASSKRQMNIQPTNANSKQTELSFKGTPVSSVSINRIENVKRRMDETGIMKTMTSTPMTLRSIMHKHQSSINSLEFSPITEKSTKT